MNRAVPSASLIGRLPNPSIRFVSADGLAGIRRFRAEDVEPLFQAVQESLNELCVSMTWCRKDYSAEDARGFIFQSDIDWQRGERFDFAIFDPGNEALLGSVGLNFINRTHGFANVGYWVRTARTRRGVATAAVKLAAGFAFDELEFHRLEFLVATSNIASQRVAARAGAKLEGALRKRLKLSGEYRDAFLYSLIRDDFARQPV